MGCCCAEAELARKVRPRAERKSRISFLRIWLSSTSLGYVVVTFVVYDFLVEFEWNANKAAANLKKHGISFPFATRVFLDERRIEKMDTSALDEARWATVGLVDGVEIFVVYTMRGELIRLISARKADRDEREEYWDG